PRRKFAPALGLPRWPTSLRAGATLANNRTASEHQGLPRNRASTPHGGHMQWEYTVSIGTAGEPGELLKELNQLGAEGWEAIGSIEAGQSQTILLKRQKQPAPKPSTANARR
ncbi:MAG: hypothetical protein M3Q85_05785, partial [Acidobacteriota bacterium]|nr:hypothetical protein [Acidobacteriota bacterium]